MAALLKKKHFILKKKKTYLQGCHCENAAAGATVKVRFRTVGGF
jgi:hypothetical protein